MKKILLTLGLAALSMQAQQDKGLQYSVSQPLVDILIEYVDELDCYGIEYHFGDSLRLELYDIGRVRGGGSIAGIAMGMFDDSRVEIYIDIDHWINSSQRRRRWTVYHELTHDIFNITHCEVTIMDTVVPDYISYGLMEDSIEELMNYLKKNN